MWIKSSDTDLTDRRLIEAGPLGHHLYHRAQLWMSSPANLTNGHISRRALRSLDDFDGITEDGAAVTLTGLADRLVKLELWRVDGDGYYDLRYAGLNPADLIEKRREAGKASAAARAAKFGSTNPRANREHREHIAEHTPEQGEHREQNVNRTRTRVVKTVSKSPDQLTDQDNSRGRDLGEDSSATVQVKQVTDREDDDPAQVTVPAIVADSQNVEPTAPPIAPAPPEIVLPAAIVLMRENAILQRAKRGGHLAAFARGDSVRHPLHGDGVVKSFYSGKVVVRFAGDQLLIDPADLELLQ
jgi:hypothetical protein